MFVPLFLRKVTIETFLVPFKLSFKYIASWGVLGFFLKPVYSYLFLNGISPKGEELALGALGKLFLSLRMMTISLLNYGSEFGKPFKALELCELY